MRLLFIVQWMGAAARIYKSGQSYLIELDGFVLGSELQEPSTGSVIRKIEEHDMGIGRTKMAA